MAGAEHYDLLVKLTEAQFGEVVARVGVETRFLPGPTAPLAQRALELMKLVAQGDGPARLEAAITRTLGAPMTPAATPAPSTVQLPGAGYDAGWYVAREESERRLNECLTQPRSPAVVRSCRGMGRTWLVEHVTRAHQARGARVVWVQFSLLDDSSEDALLRSLADQIADGCGDADPVAEVWSRPSPAPVRMQRLMQRWLAREPSAMILVLDAPDEWLENPLWSQLHNVLRAWNDAGARAPWDRLRLLMAWSTLPAAWSASAGSPFRVPEIVVEDLDDNGVQELACRHNVNLTAADMARVRDLVGGHPSYLRRLLFELHAGATLDEIEAQWQVDGGVFWEPDLRKLAELLRRDAALRDGFTALASGTAASVPNQVAERLVAAGLVVREPVGARLRYRVVSVLSRLV